MDVFPHPCPCFSVSLNSLSSHLNLLPTVATDALWAGLPVLTILGNVTFSRVAPSLIHALSPELYGSLVVESFSAYEDRAVQLAQQASLQEDGSQNLRVNARALREEICALRDAAPLFDTQQWCVHR